MDIEQKVQESITAWEQDNLIMFIVLPKLWGSSYYLVNGEKTLGGEIICDVTPSVVRVESTQVIDHYVHSEDPSGIKDIEQYRKERNELYSHCIDDTWSSLKAEFDYRSYTEQWKPVYRPVETRTEILVDLQVNVKSPNEFIIPMRKLGGDLTNTVYQYQSRSHALQLAKNIITKAGGLITDEHRVEYCKVSLGDDLNKYLTIVVPELESLLKSTFVYKGTIQDCLRKFHLDEEIITRATTAYVNRAKTIPQSSIKSVLAKLRDIQYTISNIKQTQKSTGAKSQAVKKIDDLIVLVQNSCIGTPNYIVETQCWNGKKVTECVTVEDAWDAINNRSVGGIYSVMSPTGKSVSDFIPF